MSGVRFTCTTPEVANITTAKTIIGIGAAANHRVHIKKIKLGLKGTTVTNEPVTVDYIRFTTDGTATAGAPVKSNPRDPESLQGDFVHTYTVEPSVGLAVEESFTLHPQGSVIEELPIERPIEIEGGKFWGIRLTADNAVTAIATVVCEE